MTGQPAILRRSLLTGMSLLLAAGAAQLMIPRHVVVLSTDQFSLEAMIPKSFGQWTAEPQIRLVDIDEPGGLAREIYSQTLSHAYRDPQGDIVMLLVAYGPSQSERLQLHRPELCYAAAGFTVSAAAHRQIAWQAGAEPLEVVRLMTRRETRVEPVTYWMRIGDDIATSSLDQHAIRLRYGLKGEIPDGMLVRVSSISADPSRAFDLQDRFLQDLFATIDPQQLPLLLGTAERRVAGA